MAALRSTTASPSRRQLREFGLLIGLGFPLFLGWVLPTLWGHGFRGWTLWVGGPALVLTLVAPRLLAGPYRAWMALGHGLGWINSHLILGLVHLLILQPIALLMRLLGHDPLRRRRHDGPSYREHRPDSAIDLRRIF